MVILLSCNTLNDAPNVSVPNTVIGINGLKTLAKHGSCKYKCKFDSRKYSKSKQKWNNDECRWLFAKKDYSWNPSTCICESSRHLKSIMCDKKIKRCR